MPSLRIVADENIPLAEDLFGAYGTVETLPASEISREEVHDADVLLVRSVTRVDAALLEGSSVRFVGSATIGTDHIETEYLHQRGTAFAHAPGSNADSVVEYVIAVLLRLAIRRNASLRGRTVGIVGCGNIGGRLAERLPHLGMSVLKTDAPLAEAAEREGRAHDYRSLDEIIAASDVITLHVPLAQGGRHPTEHLFDADRLAALRPDAWLINTSRGAVVDNTALGEMLRRRAPMDVVLDVWEEEPCPAGDLIERVSIGTPHIAGYSYDGKVAGTLMLLEALRDYLGESADASEAQLPAVSPRARMSADSLRPQTSAAPPAEQRDDAPVPSMVSPPDPRLPFVEYLHRLVVQMYNVAADDERMRMLATLGAAERARRFAALRRNYPARRTFAAHRLGRPQVPEVYRHAVELGLAVGLVEPPSRDRIDEWSDESAQ